MLPTLLSSIRPVVLVRSDPTPREAPWQSTQHLALLYQGGAGAHTVITREGGVGQGPVGSAHTRINLLREGGEDPAQGWGWELSAKDTQRDKDGEKRQDTGCGTFHPLSSPFLLHLWASKPWNIWFEL